MPKDNRIAIQIPEAEITELMLRLKLLKQDYSLILLL